MGLPQAEDEGIQERDGCARVNDGHENRSEAVVSLGNGNPQFEVTTRINGKEIDRQAIHDPFILTRVRLRGFAYAWRALTKGLEVQVAIDGTHGAVSAVMMLDPEHIERDTAEFLTFQAQRRANNMQAGVVGYYVDQQKAN